MVLHHGSCQQLLADKNEGGRQIKNSFHDMNRPVLIPGHTIRVVKFTRHISAVDGQCTERFPVGEMPGVSQ